MPFGVVTIQESGVLLGNLDAAQEAFRQARVFHIQTFDPRCLIKTRRLLRHSFSRLLRMLDSELALRRHALIGVSVRGRARISNLIMCWSLLVGRY